MPQTRQFLAGLGRCCVGLLLLAACDHTAPFPAGPAEAQGPLASGDDVRLTANPGADYWPSWSEDGSAILYRFAQPGHGDDDRCVGLLPAAGGTRRWELCDTRPGQSDSSSSFVGAALGADGRLIYEEMTAKANKGTPDHNVLWLADSSAPFNRRALLTFPALAGGAQVAALNDVQWISHDEFIGLAQDLVFSVPCRNCITLDTSFVGLAVVRGTVSASGATLLQIDGTAQAFEYSLAASGATVVFVRSALNVEQVPTVGGTPTIVTTFALNGNRSIIGLSCKGAACLVLTSEPNLSPATYSLWKVTLADGTQTLLRTVVQATLRTPRLSPLSGDVVVQSGLKSASDLYLFKGLLP